MPFRKEWLKKRDSLLGHGDVWYTYRSESEESSGTGYCSRRHGKGTCMSLGWYATVFQTESVSLLGCTQRLEDLKAVGRDICI